MPAIPVYSDEMPTNPLLPMKTDETDDHGRRLKVLERSSSLEARVAAIEAFLGI